MPPNYRMKLTSSAVGLLAGMDTGTLACSLARARLGAQLMRDRYVARPQNDNCLFLIGFGSPGWERAVAQSIAAALSFASPLSTIPDLLARQGARPPKVRARGGGASRQHPKAAGRRPRPQGGLPAPAERPH